MAIRHHRLAAALWLATCGAAQAGPTLYDQLGGAPGVDRITTGALRMYTSDPRLHDYFDNINLAWLKPRLAAHLCMLADGPCTYHGRSMAAAHKGLHVNEAAFNALTEDLQIAMSRADIPFRVQNRLLARLAPMERAIVTR